MLLTIHIKDYQPRKVVQDFEILKEKAPRAGHPLRRGRRSSAGPTATSASTSGPTSSGGRSSRRATSKTPRSARSSASAARRSTRSPTCSTSGASTPTPRRSRADFFGLSQVLAGAAEQGHHRPDPPPRAGRGRRDPLRPAPPGDPADPDRSSSQSPKNPLADEASLALVGDFLELEDFESVVRLAARFAGLYPKSTFLDSFQYTEALGQFHLGQYDRAIEVAEAIARATYKDANGVDQPSPNKWQAIYILGQIYDARRQPGQGRRVLQAGRRPLHRRRRRRQGPDPQGPEAPRGLGRPARARGRRRPAGGSVADGAPKVADAGGRARLPEHRRGRREGLPGRPDAALPDPAEPRRDRRDRPGGDHAAGRDDGQARRRRRLRRQGPGRSTSRSTKEGAYLVMVRGENLYASGIVLVTPAGAGSPRGARVRPGPRDGPRRRDQGPRAQGPGQGDRHRQPDVPLRPDRPPRRLRRRGGQRPGHGRRPQGRRPVRLLPRDQPASAPRPPPAPADPGRAKPDAAEHGRVGVARQEPQDAEQINQMRQIDRLQNRYQEKPQGQGVNPF